MRARADVEAVVEGVEALRGSLTKLDQWHAGVRSTSAEIRDAVDELAEPEGPEVDLDRVFRGRATWTKPKKLQKRCRVCGRPR